MKHFLTALLLLSLLFQAGCARSTSDGTSGPQAESPQLAYEATFDDGAFSPIDPGAVCYDLLEIRLCVLDGEPAKALFFPEDPILEEERREDNGRRNYNARGASGAYLHITNSSGGNLDSYLIFRTSWYQEMFDNLVMNNPADVGSFNLNNVDDLPRDGDLDFAPAAEAEAAVRSALGQIGCENLGESMEAVIISPLSRETLALLDKSHPRYDFDYETQEKIQIPLQSWGKEDECYYLSFQGQYGGIPFSREGVKYPGPHIEAVYSPRGIEFLCILSPFEVVKPGQPVDMPDPAAARELIAGKYDKIILPYPVIIQQVSLEYVMPSSGAGLIPSWRVIVNDVDCVTDEETGESFSNRHHHLLDALTGKEIVWTR